VIRREFNGMTQKPAEEPTISAPKKRQDTLAHMWRTCHCFFLCSAGLFPQFKRALEIYWFHHDSGTIIRHWLSLNDELYKMVQTVPRSLGHNIKTQGD